VHEDLDDREGAQHDDGRVAAADHVVHHQPEGDRESQSAH
jgi:hypothetical protein